VNTIGNEVSARRRRRKHSVEFKAQVLAACQPAGVSIAAVAMAHGVNANLVRRWLVDAQRCGVPQMQRPQTAMAPAAFVPLRLPSAEPAAPADIRIELHRGAITVNVHWPAGAAAECATWMRELLR
jgi:transposase-like protein